MLTDRDDLPYYDLSWSSDSLHSLSSSESFDLTLSEWDLSADLSWSSDSSHSSLSSFLDVSYRPAVFDSADASDLDVSAVPEAPPQADSSAAEKHTTPIAIHRDCI